MSTELWIGAAIFIVSYALISLRHVPGRDIAAWHGAMFGALMMILVGAVTLREAYDSVNMDTILLLLGMMLLVASLDAVGFFNITAGLLMRFAGNGRTLLATVMMLSAFLSAIVLNDAVVLMMTPSVIRCCRKADADPIPYLVAVFISANIGSVATAVGNPQNAYIATEAGIDFVTFSQYMIPLALICLIVTYVMLLALFRNRLEPKHRDVVPEVASFDRRIYPVIAIALAAIIGFVVSRRFEWSLWSVAVVCGLASYAVVATMGKEKTVGVVKRVDWGVILFFIGLFVLMAGASNTGVLDSITDAIPGFSENETTVGGLTVVTVVLSNLISNVPCVILLGTIMPDSLGLWLTLAAVSTLAGNLTMIGAAANVIVSEEAEKESIRINFWRFLKVGVPVTLVTVAIAYAYITILF